MVLLRVCCSFTAAVLNQGTEHFCWDKNRAPTSLQAIFKAIHKGLEDFRSNNTDMDEEQFNQIEETFDEAKRLCASVKKSPEAGRTKPNRWTLRKYKGDYGLFFSSKNDLEEALDDALQRKDQENQRNVDGMLTERENNGTLETDSTSGESSTE